MVKQFGPGFTVFAGVLDIITIVDTLDNLDALKDEQRSRALWTLAAASTSVSGGALELLSKRIAKRAGERIAVTAALDVAAGLLGSFAAAVGAYQAYMAYKNDGAESDSDAATAQAIQAGLLASGAVGLFLGAFGATIEVLGVALSLTGIGLILVALGVIAGIVAYFLEDGPAATWAAKTIWGTADAEGQYGTLRQAQLAMEHLMIGVQIDFAVNAPFWDRHNLKIATERGLAAQARSRASMAGQDPGNQQIGQRDRDATLRLVFPAARNLPWAYHIVGIPKQGDPVVLARHGHNFKFKTPPPSPGPPIQNAAMSHDDDTIEQTVTLRGQVFESIRATVEIFSSPKQGSRVLLREVLTGQ